MSKLEAFSPPSPSPPLNKSYFHFCLVERFYLLYEVTTTIGTNRHTRREVLNPARLFPVEEGREERESVCVFAVI